MKHVRTHLSAAAFLLFLPAAVSLTALPTAAIAQPAAPEVRALEIRSDGGLDPGSRLSFKVTGTPRAQASLRVRGLRESIPLREVGPGIYIGRYTVKRGDRLGDDTEIRGMLRSGNRTASANFTMAEVMSGPPVASAPPPVVVPAAPPLRIERFAMAPVDRMEPGTELRFALDGMPGAQAMVDLPGVSNDVALREVRPGHYEGAYTLRRADNINMSRPIVATLRAGERVATANLAPPPPPVAAVVPVSLPLQVVNHSNNGVVEGGSTHVEGRTAPFASVNVKVEAVAPIGGVVNVSQHVFSETIQADANGRFAFDFSPRFAVPGTRYDIVMVANKANASNETRLALFQRQR